MSPVSRFRNELIANAVPLAGADIAQRSDTLSFTPLAWAEAAQPGASERWI